MILDQKLEFDNDKKGTVHLYNTIDVGTAAELAKDVTDAGGGRSKERNGEMVLMGYIPPELWLYDINLINAKVAREYHDKAEYTHQIREFFRKNPQYAVKTPKKYF